jgi:putative pyoverdin transport system ATP-binding/permease protein
MIKLLEFISRESDAPKGTILLMATLSGLASGSILVGINIAAEQIYNRELQEQLFFIILVTLILAIYTQQYSTFQSMKAIEEAILKVRLRIINKLRHTELRFIEETGVAPIYTPLTRDTNLISQATFNLVSSIQAGTMLIVSALYLAWLSTVSFLISIIFTSIAIFLYLYKYKSISEKLHLSANKETQFFEKLSSILGGFKEIKVNRRRSDGVFDHTRSVSYEIKDLKEDTTLQLVSFVTYALALFYVLLIVLVFIIPSFHHSTSDEIFKVTATVLFIAGYLRAFMVSIPMIIKSNVAVEELYRLEEKLDEAASNGDSSIPSSPAETFQTIRLDNLVFHYSDKYGQILFSVGPVNLTVKQGELLFIVGGNGSGKSTVLKLLTGLYYPISGNIYLDDERIDRSNYQNYRELFSIIFTDFYLFERLYGLPDVDEQRVRYWLRAMELNNKTQYLDGQFTNLDLSTGQKKRLAFVSAVLEDRPIYIFDELAADQDPQFRKHFYEVILQDLKKRGKTVIAVTHDDKYFNVADRVLEVEDGKLIAYTASMEENGETPS